MYFFIFNEFIHSNLLIKDNLFSYNFEKIFTRNSTQILKNIKSINVIFFYLIYFQFSAIAFPKLPLILHIPLPLPLLHH